jgi:hypothetical protein
MIVTGRGSMAAEHTQRHRRFGSEGFARVDVGHTGKPRPEHDREGDGMDAGIRDDVRIGTDVWLTVPPFSEYLRTVRLVAADAAGRAGLDYDEVEDFRIAVDELCHFLMTATDHELELSFRVAGKRVDARGCAPRRPGSVVAPLDPLSSTIIRSLADHHEILESDVELGFVVSKESRAVLDR